jgi:hypothetical protein
LREKRNWTESNDLDPLVAGAFSRRFYQTLSRVVHAELRVLRGARALGSLVRAPLGRRSSRLRKASELRHAAAWMLHRVRLETERRKVPGESSR